MGLLTRNKMDHNPFIQFAKWFEEAKKHSGMQYPEAMCVSNINDTGYPDSRMVLMKNFDERGFVFYTNIDSPNKKSFHHSSKSCITFYWPGLRRQVRIHGMTEIVSDEEADAYFATRPRLSQLGAWASRQSEILDNRTILVRKVAQLGLKYGSKKIPRPPFWKGIRIIPEKFEFWQDQRSRLHDRFLYTRKKDNLWDVKRLNP